MEESQLEHRIRFYQYLQNKDRQASGAIRSLAEILKDHTLGMTRDELRKYILETLAPKLERALNELDTQAARAEELNKEAEELRREAEREREARRTSEKEKIDLRKELDRLRKELEDAKNTKATDNRNRYGSSSRKTRHSVDKHFGKADRQKEKEDFDGTEESLPEESSADTEKSGLNGGKIITEKELAARQARQNTHYKLSDASEKIVYKCDTGSIPEGWILEEDEKPVTRILFDTQKVIVARIIEFVKVKRLVKYIREDGSEGERWEYDRIHIPPKEEKLRQDVGLSVEEDSESEKPFDMEHIPGRIPGTSTTAAFATEMLVDTQLGFVPINRLWHMMKEYGFRISRQTLVNWKHAYATHLKPAYEGIKAVVLRDGSILYCDETWFRLHLNQMTRKVYEWIIGNKKEKAVFYYYDDGSRGRKVIAELLEGKNIKAIHTDGYNAYLFLEGIGVIHITCAAHVWRYIMDWYNATKSEDAGQLLTCISTLYLIESEIRGKSPEEILKRRQSTEVTEILTRYKAKLDTLFLRIDSLPDIGVKAIKYAQAQYPKMSRWREDPDYEIDNNFAERSARPMALERKNSMFYASHKGAEASCIIRSVVETCRMWGKSVREYFYEYFTGFVSGRTDYENLMPWSMASQG